MQGSDSYRLVVRRGPQPNQTFDLTKEQITLGRDITNDIVINDPEVSRHHLRLSRGPEGYTLEDLGSTNGTFVNGQRLTSPRPLRPGDAIGLGETVTLGYDLGARGAAAGAPQQAPQESPQPPQQYPPQQPQQPQQQPAQPQQQQYGQQPAYGQQQSEYGQQQQQYSGYDAPQPDYGYGAPQQAPPGYEYDPYAVREEEGRSTLRWAAIGCGVISVFCCCSTIVGLVIIDTLSLWYDIPIIRDLAPLFESIASALGMI
jgi:hypothetical protein